MYYNLYHASDLCKIVKFLREIESIEFECNAYVLVLVQIDLIHFEHTKCISSTSIKTAHGYIVLHAVCHACRAVRCLFFEQLFCSRRTVAEQ